jgi:hypothetical protein
MKSCPTCNRTFEDTFTFCLADGSLLNAPFDPHATLVIPEPRNTEPPTEVLKLEETKREIPPTIASPQPQQKPEQLISTIAAPALEPPQNKDSPAQPTGKPNQALSIMARVGALFIIGLIFFIAINRTSSTTENSNKANERQSASSTSAQPASGSEAIPDNEPSGKVLDIPDSNYDNEVINSRTPVLIHFWASWSVPDR